MIAREQLLRNRVKWLTWFFIAALVVSGATAIPLETELNLMAGFWGNPQLAADQQSSALARWIFKVRDALHQNNAQFPFMAYGTDWLAFGHFAIAVAFIGPLRDPVRNVWVYTFGLIACVLILPYAFLCGAMRGIPVYWRLIDCSFGVLGFIPLWICRRDSLALERIAASQNN